MLGRLTSEIRYRLRALFRRRLMDNELDDEVRFHLAQEADKLVEAGRTRADAERQARIAFGGIDRIKDDTRDVRGVAFLESLAQDCRYALRGLRVHPAFTAGVVATLGLGIGANATMFGVVDRLLFRAPQALRDPHQVHRVYLEYSVDGGRRLDRSTEFARYLDFTRLARSVSAIAAFQTRTIAIGAGTATREVLVSIVTPSYFALFDVQPVLGRFFGAEVDRMPEGEAVVVLSHGFWQAQFGGRRDVVGQTLQVDRVSATILGVAPPGFGGVSDDGMPAAFVPLTSFAHTMRGPSVATNYNWSWLQLLVRRPQNLTIDAVESDLTSVYRQSWQIQREGSPQLRTVDAAQPRIVLGPVQLGRGPQAGLDARVVLWTSAVALIVLLIACANVANLLLSRAVNRRREIAMRLALGVSRGRLARQLVTESLVLSAVGGIAGLAIARWGGTVMRRLVLPEGLDDAVFTDARTLGFVLAATLGAALMTALIPTAFASRTDVAVALKSGAREGTYRRSRMRTSLLVVQAALSVVLLVGAGLFVASLRNARAFRLGYDPDAILFASANLRGTRLAPSQSKDLLDRMIAAAERVPGVTSVTPAVSVPFWSNEGRGLWVPGVDSLSSLGQFTLQVGGPDYFRTMGTRIVSGRPFGTADGPTSARVVVVSEGMARAIWPGRDPLGQCFHISEATAPCTTVVGVAEEARMSSLADPREFAYYIPATQYDGEVDPQLLIRTDATPTAILEPMRRALQGEMSGAAYVNAVAFSELVNPNFRAWSFGATMFASFGALALVLASIGLYSLISYDVAQRRQELGVRVALGASSSRLAILVMSSGLRLVLLGIAIGGTIALGATRWLRDLLFNQSPRDPLIFAGVVGLLLGVAVLASLAPAWRAARVDPSVTLRGD